MVWVSSWHGCEISDAGEFRAQLKSRGCGAVERRFAAGPPLAVLVALAVFAVGGGCVGITAASMEDMADVKMMGPNELREYAKRGQREHDEVNKELERRWHSYDGFLPDMPFKSILDSSDDGE